MLVAAKSGSICIAVVLVSVSGGGIVLSVRLVGEVVVGVNPSTILDSRDVEDKRPLCICIHMYIYIHIHIHTYMYVYTGIYHQSISIYLRYPFPYPQEE